MSPEVEGPAAMLPRVCAERSKLESPAEKQHPGLRKLFLTHLSVDRLSREFKQGLEDVTRAPVLDEAFKLADEPVEQDALGKVVHRVQQLFEDDARLAVAGQLDFVTRERLEGGPEQEGALVFDLFLDFVAVVVDDELGRRLAVPLCGHFADLFRDAFEVRLCVWIGFGQRVRVDGRRSCAVESLLLGELIPFHPGLALALPPFPF